MKQIFIQFGGTGDLVRNKLLPAYASLLEQGYDLYIIALGRRFETLESYSEYAGIAEDSLLYKHLWFVQFSMEDTPSKKRLTCLLQQLIGDTCDIELIYYIALQPSLYESAVYDIRDIHESLEGCRLKQKIIVEKPFGFDRESARNYNGILLSLFQDDQIYRIDHYLGKEFMQSLLVMRFHNDVIKALWNKYYIDHIQIIFDEASGVDQRLNFYRQIGVVRDTVQNHILQIITHLLMGEPVDFSPEEMSHEKRKVLRSVRPITNFSLAQYATLEDHKDAQAERIPTYCAFKLTVDTFGFSGVPIYVRTGKMQKNAKSKIFIAFKHFLSSPDRNNDLEENRLIITLHPEMSIDLQINMKEPGSVWSSRPVQLNFDHLKTFRVNTPEAYQQIIEKILLSDKSLFPTIDEILDAWSIVEPMLTAGSSETELYDDRTMPACAESLIEEDGRTWFD